jgi:parallel beta-helix repeat protein
MGGGRSTAPMTPCDQRERRCGRGSTCVGLMPGVANVRIHNWSLTGFGLGVEVRGAATVQVEGLQISGADLGGPPPGEVGITIVNSRGVALERNVVTGTLLGIFVRGGGAGGNRIANNTLTGGTGGQLGICRVGACRCRAAKERSAPRDAPPDVTCRVAGRRRATGRSPPPAPSRDCPRRCRRPTRR